MYPVGIWALVPSVCTSCGPKPEAPIRETQNKNNKQKPKDTDEGNYTRYMAFNRGARRLRDHERDRYHPPGNCYEDGSDTDYYNDGMPWELRYIPRPGSIPNGMMAALDIFPYACNEGRREHYFKAYGITLATEDACGKVMYYNGDAELRVTEPGAGMAIEIPAKRRTNHMRERMFRMNAFARPEAH